MPDQFYDLTIGEILRHYKGYQKRESYQWERARFIAWYGSLPYLKKGTTMQPEDIMSLPTDPTDEEKAIMRLEQAEAEKQAINAVLETYRQMGYNV
jgi:hypothetical protein